MKRATLNSIAKEAGVSKTTASFVLNGKGNQHKINKETQERILKIADEQKYKPSFLAQTLSSGKTMTLGIMLSSLEDHFTAKLVEVLSIKLQDVHYRLLLGISGGTHLSEKDILEDFITRQTDAIICISPKGANEWGHFLVQKDVPVLVVGHLTGDTIFPSVTVDYKHSINLLLQNHLQKHHKAIGFIGDHTSKSRSAEAIYDESYTHRFDIKSDYKKVIKNTGELQKAIKTIADKKVNALILATPELAKEAIALLQQNEIKDFNIELSCVGWNPAFTFYKPGITGCDFQPEAFALKTAEWLAGLQLQVVTSGSEPIEPLLIQSE